MISPSPRAAFSKRPQVRPQLPASAAVTANIPIVHPVTRCAVVCGHRNIETNSHRPRIALIARAPMPQVEHGDHVQGRKLSSCSAGVRSIRLSIRFSL